MKIREPDWTEERIKQSKWYGNEEIILDVGKLIRCKDCKHRLERVVEHGVRFMRSDGKCPFEAIKHDDYYCADADPKDGGQDAEQTCSTHQAP